MYDVVRGRKRAPNSTEVRLNSTYSLAETSRAVVFRRILCPLPGKTELWPTSTLWLGG